eukprot:CAMPEP_0113942864 /NCGR_PEP_ID=MMETSP1339-20121228/13398_1 /TAXON_ID=94617 /ORGANISM="Fibrocapsa japonica" /LENGTH=207 /DNA_ID=CAMNT_0000947527 /DNA_START=72 /DNA_END=695 /DNA_ORIENTATION=- /assembly_acc=CAM_ASM_000762
MNYPSWTLVMLALIMSSCNGFIPAKDFRAQSIVPKTISQNFHSSKDLLTRFAKDGNDEKKKKLVEGQLVAEQPQPSAPFSGKPDTVAAGPYRDETREEMMARLAEVAALRQSVASRVVELQEANDWDVPDNTGPRDVDLPYIQFFWKMLSKNTKFPVARTYLQLGLIIFVSVFLLLGYLAFLDYGSQNLAAYFMPDAYSRVPEFTLN